MSAPTPATSTPATSTPVAAAGIVLVPSDRFFVQVVTLEAGTDAGQQVEFALEAMSPFPLAQVYYGHLLAPDRSQALVFAAYRRRFTAAETEAWAQAELVLPAFLALAGKAPAGEEFVVQAHETGLTGVVWDAKSPLPSALLAHTGTAPPTDQERTAFVAELRTLSGRAGAPVRFLEGETRLESHADGSLSFRIGGHETTRLPAWTLEDADVRDKALLDEQRRGRRRDLWLWRALLAMAGLMGLAAVLEIGALGIGAWSARRRVLVTAQAPQVRRVETAQALAERIEHLASRQLRPFEMLGLISQRRPRTIQFLRATTTGLLTLEVEAQTANAADVGNYEAILRGLPGLARVETHDLRSREGLMTFVLAVTFKPEAVRPEGGPE